MSSKRTILVVDDDPRDVELVFEALAEQNLEAEVVAVRDGLEALDFLLCRGEYESVQTPKPVVIFLDLKLPFMSGLDVLREIRANAQLKNLPVVIWTSSREKGDILLSYELGTNAYVVKPVDFLEFRKVIQHMGTFWSEMNEVPIQPDEPHLERQS
ncbi:MAG: response regulator [Thermoleophilia bacterium]|nr:response regulator [Thermoleophilia bacterium]